MHELSRKTGGWSGEPGKKTGGWSSKPGKKAGGWSLVGDYRGEFE